MHQPIFLFRKSTQVLFFIGTAMICHAQRDVPAVYTSNAGVNYIRTCDAVAPTANPNSLALPLDPSVAKVGTQYLDELGQPVQTVIKKGSKNCSGTTTDVVTAIEYNAFGSSSLSAYHSLN